MKKNLLNSLSTDQISLLLKRAETVANSGKCCPTLCGKRYNDPPCGAVKDGIKVASFAVHDGEEPCISGWNGAGNIFFSGCTLQCVFCQNWPISHNLNGRVYSDSEFKTEVIKMMSKKVHNINLVTSDHYLFQVLKSLIDIKDNIEIPISYNCSGYFAEETLDIILKFADIFLYDVKYCSMEHSKRYSKFKGYVNASWKGVERLLEESIPWIENDLGLLKRGLIFRHLVLPGLVDDSIEVLEKLAEFQKRGLKFKLSLMSQYFPAHKSQQYPEIDRKITEDEYLKVSTCMDKLEIDGWIQGF